MGSRIQIQLWGALWLLGCSFLPGQESQLKRLIPKSASNPTGLQIGVVPEGFGKLPKDAEEWAEKGAMASADMDWKTARQAYLEMLRLAPDNPLAISNLGAVEFRLGRRSEAAQLLEKATKLAPEIAQNWLTLGVIYWREEKLHLAMSALSRALHEDPGDPRAHNYLGVVIRDLGWNVGAEIELQRALILDPGYAEAHFNLAVMYLDQKPPLIELARRHYYAAVDYGSQADPEFEALLQHSQDPISSPSR
ncbi:MAG: tetratricopeptide repeat protein [Verrucomicrobiota bacterium]